ncbi:hypothetical protein E1B28_013132 [Marasmius oreades]|uniref:HMG box domain-containing protein n=1 Tax=Marasmius oreades TaxID=181124 RepID=A0A9P7ULP2_9AGAR|nr:uncharacterized protein E1B28_013132 [Marasmius oreades]KAG7087152.1 hypothetical protein E1B28_013132 [Marasmius oreades]
MEMESGNGALIPSSSTMVPFQEPTQRVPRPRNKFMILRQEIGKAFKGLGLSQQDISTLTSSMWDFVKRKGMDMYWSQKVDQEHEEHQHLYPHYKFAPQKSSTGKGKQLRGKGKQKQLDTIIEETSNEPPSYYSYPSPISVPPSNPNSGTVTPVPQVGTSGMNYPAPIDFFVNLNPSDFSLSRSADYDCLFVSMSSTSTSNIASGSHTSSYL